MADKVWRWQAGLSVRHLLYWAAACCLTLITAWVIVA